MNLTGLIKHRLRQLGHDQRDLASAVKVTESYISQLLTGKKSLPAPNRSTIYRKIEAFLKLPDGKLMKLADAQRTEELKRKIEEPARPLFQEIRELILRKCKPDKAKQLRPIFGKEAFGEIERLVTQKLLDAAKEAAKQELDNETWLRAMARLNHKTYEEMSGIILKFLDTDIFHLSVENFGYFLEPLIESWDIDVVTFGIKVILTPELGRERTKQFEFVEQKPEPPGAEEPGLREFLQNTFLSGDVTQEELAFLKRLRFEGKKPTALYYYRELQNLRDPIHFQGRASREGIRSSSIRNRDN